MEIQTHAAGERTRFTRRTSLRQLLRAPPERGHLRETKGAQRQEDESPPSRVTFLRAQPTDPPAFPSARRAGKKLHSPGGSLGPPTWHTSGKTLPPMPAGAGDPVSPWKTRLCRLSCGYETIWRAASQQDPPPWLGCPSEVGAAWAGKSKRKPLTAAGGAEGSVPALKDDERPRRLPRSPACKIIHFT